MMGQCCGESCLPPAEVGPPSSLQSLNNASRLPAGSPPGEQGRYELCPACRQLPPGCSMAISFMWTQLWPESSLSLLSLTHTLGKASDSSEMRQRSRVPAFPRTTPPHCSDTARKMEAGQISPPEEALGPFWRVLSAHCKHPPWRQPHRKGLRCPAWGLGVI